MRKVIGFLLVSVLTSLAWAGPGDNSLIVATSQEPPVVMGDFLNILNNQAIKAEMQVYLFTGIYRVDIGGNNVPGVVTEVATEENGRLRFEDIGDGEQRLEIDLTLRDDVYWSDGTPITTDDVAFYFEVGKAPGMPTLAPDYWERIDLAVQDDRNFTVTFEPAQYVDLIGAPISYAPAHVMREEWDETLAAVEALDLETEADRVEELYRGFFSEFASPSAINAGRMVYSGAFQIDRWNTGSSLVMSRNPNFFNHPENQDAYAQRVEYQFIEDTNSLLVAVIGGAVDATSAVGITFDAAISPQVARRAEGRFNLWFVPTAIWEHLDINKFENVQTVADLGLADIRTRQAILHALDRQGLVDELFDGLQPVSHTWVNPQHPFYYEDVPQYEHNPERARELLAEMGWEPGADGILEREVDGRTVRFELEFVTTAGAAPRERAQQFMADDLRQVGIDVNINNAPSGVVFSGEYFSRAYEGSWTGMFMFAWISSFQESGDLWACDFIPTPENNFTGQNIGNWCNEEFDAIREQALITFDLEQVAQDFEELQTIWANELPALPLYFRSTPYAVRQGLVNYVANTYVNGNGYPPVEPELVGWSQNGAEMVYDQADYALEFD